ncbi:NAD(P)-binding [Fusarium albosuccineum]|uniref:NAD(P)-binding n=1 Tax=Fusarium albosuccineum TaxID=1237068 RepID=A0A8H4LE65_9HYPO|nr:NAD(P)-binding [Fusarium albosuccineum]
MKIVIAGISGKMGCLLTQEALERGHRVRGLGRSEAKLPKHIQADSRVEFVEMASYFDEDILAKACTGCDAVICAYGIVPHLQLEGQLFLLRAAERANIRKFVTASWSGDYRRLNLGDMESYDPYMCLRAQALLETTIKPIYVFVGVFAETMFASYHPDNVERVWWLNDRVEVLTWGTGDEELTITPMRDSAAYTIEILERDDAEDGGDWMVYSWRTSLREAAQVFTKVTGRPKEIVIEGSLDDLAALEAKERAKGSKLNYWTYLGLSYFVNLLTGRMEGANDSRSAEFPDGCRTSMESWFAASE